MRSILHRAVFFVVAFHCKSLWFMKDLLIRNKRRNYYNYYSYIQINDTDCVVWILLLLLLLFQHWNMFDARLKFSSFSFLHFLSHSLSLSLALFPICLCCLRSVCLFMKLLSKSWTRLHIIFLEMIHVQTRFLLRKNRFLFFSSSDVFFPLSSLMTVEAKEKRRRMYNSHELTSTKIEVLDWRFGRVLSTFYWHKWHIFSFQMR